jgi:NADPH-dependent 2,4-dienoyl-CoA reductase/sulfur reductase-like enzyme
MRLLVVGGSDAGVSACLRARAVDPSVETTMVTADAYPNYSICGLPMFLAGEVSDWHHLAHRTREELTSAGIDLYTDTRIVHIDPAARVAHGVGPYGEVAFSFDRLILATGAASIRPPIPGMDAAGVFTLHDMSDGLALHAFLAVRQPRSTIIIGAGYIGCEMADAFIRRGMRVMLLEQAPSILPTVDKALGQELAHRMQEHGVDVRPGVRVRAIEAQADRLRVHIEMGAPLVADMVLVAAGVRPVTNLATALGIPTGVRGAIRVSRDMRTSFPHIWAAGDCVETWHRLLERPTYLPLGTTAHKQGQIAGENAVGGERQFQGTLGTQVVKVLDTVVGRTGLTEAEARMAGWDAVTEASTQWDHKAYYPGAQRLHLRIVADRSSGRLLGAQILGPASVEVAKRLDILAVALYHNMSVADLSDLDLSYTPPLASPWDAVQLAAQAWEEHWRQPLRGGKAT